MGGGYKKLEVVKGSPPKTLLKDIIYNTVTHTRHVLLIIDTYSQVLNVWKKVSPTILESKIFWGLVPLGDRYRMRCARVIVSLRALSQPVELITSSFAAKFKNWC